MRRKVGELLNENAKIAGEINDAKASFITEQIKSALFTVDMLAKVEELEDRYHATDVNQRDRLKDSAKHRQRAKVLHAAAVAMGEMVDERREDARRAAAYREATRQQVEKHNALVRALGST